MRIKRYEGNDMQELLRRVKAELGKDAVILHTQRTRRGGLLGVGARIRYEILAASDLNTATSVAPEPARPQSRVTTTLASESTASQIQELKREIQNLRASLGLAARGEETGPLATLLSIGVDAPVAQKILGDAVPSSRDELVNLVSGIFTPAGPVLGGSGRQVVALIGPTGVGKTTTIAKMAAVASLDYKAKVALITSDTYRIGAVEQLRTYCQILRLPLEVALSPDEMAAAVHTHQDKDLILIDTVGRGQKHFLHLSELAAVLRAAEPTQTHLVLAASSDRYVMIDVIEKFGMLSPDRLIFTKLDEAVRLGEIVNVVVNTGMPVSYITDGQKVPEDLHLADPRLLAERIVGEYHA
ncbi:MAG: flagellar biosynthesis protein FlhF [Armatimonadota bacterium]